MLPTPRGNITQKPPVRSLAMLDTGNTIPMEARAFAPFDELSSKAKSNILAQMGYKGIAAGQGHIVDITHLDSAEKERLRQEGKTISNLPSGEWVHGPNVDAKTRNSLEQGTATVFLGTGEVLSNVQGRLGTASELSLCFTIFKQIMEAQHPKTEENDNDYQKKQTRSLQGCGVLPLCTL